MTAERSSRIHKEVHRLILSRTHSTRDVLIGGTVLLQLGSPAQKWRGKYRASSPVAKEADVNAFVETFRRGDIAQLPDRFDILADNAVLYILEPDEEGDVKEGKGSTREIGVILFDPYAPEDPGTVILCEPCKDANPDTAGSRPGPGPRTGRSPPGSLRASL